MISGMARVPAEDRKQIATTVTDPDGSRRHYRAHNGFYEMSDRDAKAQLSSGGFGKSWMVAGVPSPSKGYRCTQCGFGTHFTTCGKCGGACVRESEYQGEDSTP